MWIVFGAVFLTGLGMSWRMVGNPDLGFQLNAAKYVLTHGDVPRAEPFLYTVPWSRYVDLQWLWQLSIYGANQWGGILGMNLLCVGYTFIASAILLIRCRNWCGGFGTVSAGFLLFFFMVNFWDFRPHTISWIYLSLVLLCLERHFNGDKRSVWFLPLVMLGWVNCHALFSLGLMTIGLWTAGELVEACLAKGEDRDKGFEKVYRLVGAGALSGLACLVNPYGWEGWMFPFRQFSLLTSAHIAKDSVFGINEFVPLWGKALVFSQYGRFCLPLNGILLRLLFIGVGVGFLLRRPRWPAPVWILGVAFTALYLTAVKNWSYFSFALIPYAVIGWSQRMLPWRTRAAVLTRVFILALCGLLLLLMRVDWWSRATSGLGSGLAYSPTGHSRGASEIIRRAGPEVRIMNPHDLGGWLAWATGQKVYIDGRNDNYPERLYRESVATGLAENFKALIEVIRANVVVARELGEGVWIETLAKEPDWRLVFRSDGILVFMRNDLAPEIPALGREDTAVGIPSDFAAWDRQLRIEAAKALPDWWRALPFGQLVLDGVAGQSAGSILLGRSEEAQAYAWAGICKNRYFIVELWVNLAAAFEMAKEYRLADFCWDTILRKVPDKDLQERAEKARARRNKPNPSPHLEEMRRKGLR
jgi:hypothetical protein